MSTPQPPQNPGGGPQWGPTPGQGGPPPGQQPFQPPAPGQQPFQPPAPGQQPFQPPAPGQQPFQPPAPGQQPFQPPQPYQPPQPGQGFGQQPMGPPPGPGGYPGPPAAAAKQSSKKKNWISVIVLVVLVGGLGIFAYIEGKSNVLSAEAGDCIHVNSDTDFEVVDCASPEAQYRVLSVVDGLSSGALCDLDPDYDSAIEITGDTTKSLCLQTWLQVGDCVQEDGSWAECGSAESAYEVNAVLEDTQDDTGCPDTTAFVRVYEGENNVICLTGQS